MSDIDQFRKLAQPPPWALSKIGGGRLRGMTDIKPAWRIQAMTEVYGLCGIGWKYAITRQWTEPGCNDQTMAFVDVDLYIKVNGEWSESIPGTGGSMLTVKESGGLHSSDEAFKMATTDALSTAMKMIGMGADVYAGMWTGSKYQRNAEPTPPPENANVTALLDQIRAAFAKHYPNQEDKQARLDLLQAHFGCPTWTRVTKLGENELKNGLAALLAALEPVSQPTTSQQAEEVF
jgi:hypothetical protein